MSRWRRVHRDANHLEIAHALEKTGCSVLDLSMVGGHCPDILVGYRGVSTLLEIKSGDRARWRRADDAGQEEWRATWRGRKVHRVTSVDEAFAVILTE